MHLLVLIKVSSILGLCSRLFCFNFAYLGFGKNKQNIESRFFGILLAVGF